MYKTKFKTFGGSYIHDITEYLREYIKNDPTVTITVGADSIQRRRKTVYAITIMLYNTDVRRGAHVVFFRENVTKIRDNHERLHKEAQYVHDVATYLHNELLPFYKRKDLIDDQLKKYKFHLAKCNGDYSYVLPHQEEVLTKNMTLTSADRPDYKLVDIHVDFNPFEGNINEKGVHKNKSYAAYKAYVPWLKGLGFRVFSKPLGWASTSAADLLLQD
jgi:predicted RNase H-related nuclease YkuK (DUF458 family)